MPKHKNKQSPKQNGKGGTPPLNRPMQGIDQKSFVMNDIFPINLAAPSNDAQYTVTISADANGYTWAIVRDGGGGSVVAGGSQLYAVPTEQFAVQSLMYTKYYTHRITLDLSLSQGGSVYSFSPIVEFVNPSGAGPFVAPSNILSLISSPQHTKITMPYTKKTSSLDFARWMVSMQDRAWRQTRLTDGTRELYETDASSGPESFQLPTLVKAFQFTVPAGTFDPGAGLFTVGLVKICTHYMFSQRRTDIAQLIEQQTQRIRAEERERAANMLRNGQLLSAMVLEPQSQSETQRTSGTPRAQGDQANNIH